MYSAEYKSLPGLETLLCREVHAARYHQSNLHGPPYASRNL